MDHMIWEYLAYCAGTGGSLLVIGSAAGVAVMGMEKMDFIWYVKKMSKSKLSVLSSIPLDENEAH